MMKFALQGSRAFLWRPQRVAGASSSSSSFAFSPSASASSHSYQSELMRKCAPRSASFSAVRLDERQRQDSADLREPHRLRRDKISATLRAVKTSRQQHLHEVQRRLEQAASGAQVPGNLLVEVAPSETDARTAKFVRELLDRRSASASDARGKSPQRTDATKQAHADEAAILKAQQQEIHEQLRAMREAEESEEFEAFRQRVSRNGAKSLNATTASKRSDAPSAQSGRNRRNNRNSSARRPNGKTSTSNPHQNNKSSGDDVELPISGSSSGRVLQSIHALRRNHRRRSALPSRSMTKKSLLAIEESLESLKAGANGTPATSHDVASIIWHWALRGNIEHAEKLAGDSNVRFGVPADAAVLRALAKGYIHTGDIEKAYTVVTDAGPRHELFSHGGMLNDLVAGWSRQGNTAQAASFVSNTMVPKHGLLPNTATLNALVGGWVREGRLDEAEATLWQFSATFETAKPDHRTFTALARGYSAAGRHDEAVAAVRRMHAFADAAVATKGKVRPSILAAADVSIYNRLIGALSNGNTVYGRPAQPDLALGVFDLLLDAKRSPSASTWSSFRTTAEIKAALELYQRRLKSGSAAIPTRKHCRKALDDVRAKSDQPEDRTSEHSTRQQIQPRLPPVDAVRLHSQIIRVFSSGSSLFDGQSRPDVVMQVFWDCLEQDQVPGDEIWASLDSNAEQQAALALLFKRLSDGSTSMRPMALPSKAEQIHSQLAAASDTSGFDDIISLLSRGAPHLGLKPHPEAALQMFASIVDTGHPVPQTTLRAFDSDIEQEIAAELLRDRQEVGIASVKGQ